jgi:hypothetical protein
MEDLVKKLSDPSSIEFYKGLASLKKIPALDGPSGVDLLLTVGKNMSSEGAIPHLEQADRIDGILAALNLSAEGKENLASKGHSHLPAHLLNSLAKSLSPHLRKTLFRGARPELEQVLDAGAVEVESIAVIEDTEKEPIISSSNRCTVILLSNSSQESNKQLLDKSGFASFKYNTFEQFRSDYTSTSDICACVVDESFLSPLDAEEQKQFIKLLSSLSSLLWIRIDERGLKISQDDLRRIIKKTQCRVSINAEELSVQESGLLRVSELSDIIRADGIVRVADSVQLIPAELTKDELRLLISAVKKHYQQHEVEDIVPLNSVETRFILGGLSGAKIVIVNLLGADRFIVAKIGDKTELLEEMDRYNHFVKSWNDSLHPVVSFHSTSAVILSDFIGDGADGAKPAPVLEDILDSLWNNEIFGYRESEYTQTLTNLFSGFERFVRSLSNLNRKSPKRTDYDSKSNPYLSCFEALEARSITCGLNDNHRKARSIAQMRFERLANSGTAHGDIHFRNILVRNELEFFLIDFAGSGPGHPAVDLCRLIVALFSMYFRADFSEKIVHSLIADIFIHRKSKPEVVKSYPDMLIPRINDLCITACIDAVGCVVNCVTSCAGTHDDYIASLNLIAWQCMLLPGRQVANLKVLIDELSQYILKDGLCIVDQTQKPPLL